jgi:hypothetical protein
MIEMLMQLPNGTWISAPHVVGLATDIYGAVYRVAIRLEGGEQNCVYLSYDTEAESRRQRDMLAKEINAKRTPVR